MRESIERVVDDMETKREEAIKNSANQHNGYWFGYWTGVSNVLGYEIKELKKVLDDYPNV